MSPEDFERLLTVLENQQEVLRQHAALIERQGEVIARLSGVDVPEAAAPEDSRPCRIRPPARRYGRTRGGAR